MLKGAVYLLQTSFHSPILIFTFTFNLFIFNFTFLYFNSISVEHISLSHLIFFFPFTFYFLAVFFGRCSAFFVEDISLSHFNDHFHFLLFTQLLQCLSDGAMYFRRRHFTQPFQCSCFNCSRCLLPYL